MASVLGFDSGGSRRRFFNSVAPAPPAPLSLDNLIEYEVIPRLVVAHPAAAPVGFELLEPATVAPDDVERFARLALSKDAHALLEGAEEYMERGITAETLFVELLAPAARALGRGWEDDSVDFVDVTMGLWRLQEVLREIAARAPPGAHSGSLRAMFTPMPEEQHSFGAAMVAECFARAGWDADLMIDASRAALLGRVAEIPLDLVGLTVSCDCHIDRLRPLITAIRNVSVNPKLRIMIGGRVANLNPGLATYVGADASALTATQAVALANRLVEKTCLAAS